MLSLWKGGPGPLPPLSWRHVVHQNRSLDRQDSFRSADHQAVPAHPAEPVRGVAAVLVHCRAGRILARRQFILMCTVGWDEHFDDDYGVVRGRQSNRQLHLLSSARRRVPRFGCGERRCDRSVVWNRILDPGAGGGICRHDPDNSSSGNLQGSSPCACRTLASPSIRSASRQLDSPNCFETAPGHSRGASRADNPA